MTQLWERKCFRNGWEKVFSRKEMWLLREGCEWENIANMNNGINFPSPILTYSCLASLYHHHHRAGKRWRKKVMVMRRVMKGGKLAKALFFLILLAQLLLNQVKIVCLLNGDEDDDDEEKDGKYIIHRCVYTYWYSFYWLTHYWIPFIAVE